MASRASRVGGALGRKIGPAPAGIWLGFAAVAAYLYQHRKGAPRPDVSVPPQSLNYYQQTGGYNVYYGEDPPPGGYGDPPPMPFPNPNPEPEPIPIGKRPPPPSGRKPPPGPPEYEPPPERWPPPAPGPGRPGGADSGIELPILGLVPLPTFRLPAIPFPSLRPAASSSAAIADGASSAGMRATVKRPALRAPLKAAQRATELAPGLVGLAALEGPEPERGRRTMPPAASLRQRPAPPRVTDPGTQRNVKTDKGAA